MKTQQPPPTIKNTACLPDKQSSPPPPRQLARSLAGAGGRAGLTAIAAARGVLGPRKFDGAVYQWLRAASTVKSSPSPFSVS